MSFERDIMATFEAWKQEWDTRMTALEEKGRLQRMILRDLCREAGRTDLEDEVRRLD